MTCRQDLWQAGHDFKAPKIRNDSGWAAAAHVKESGRRERRDFRKVGRS